MDSSKNERWIIPFKKLVRVNAYQTCYTIFTCGGGGGGGKKSKL